MKIAFVHQPIFPILNHSQSIPILTYELARRLARSCDVIIYAAGGRFQKKVASEEGVDYCGMPVGADEWVLKLLKGWRLITRFSNVERPVFTSNFYYLGYILQVANDLRKQQCDIIHLHHLTQYIPIIRAFNPNSKIVLHMHIDWLAQLDQSMIERRLREVDLIFGCSDYITERIRQRFPQYADRCQTLHNGVDVDYFVDKTDRSATTENVAKRLLFVGRVSPEKGVHVLLDAFQTVLQHYPQAQLEIIGKEAVLPVKEFIALSDDDKVKDLTSFYPGSYVARLRNKLSPSVASQLSFKGAVKHAQLLNHYQNADVFIFPSVWNEPFGMSLVEAMAAGVPVVATRVGGVTEIVEDGKTGLLVERDDADALATAILRLFSDEELRKSLGKAGRGRVLKLFSWEPIVEKLLYHYKNLCDRQKNL